MRNFGAAANAAIAAGAVRVGWAVEIELNDGNFLRWTDVAAGITITGAHTCRAGLLITPPASGQTVLTECRIRCADADGAVLATLDAGTMRDAQVKVYLLVEQVPNPLVPLLFFQGAVDQAGVTKLQAEIIAGGPVATWAKLLPDVYSATCRYRSATQCAFVATCNKTYAACTTNAQTAIFGGFRYLLTSGTRIEFHEDGVTVGGA